MNAPRLSAVLWDMDGTLVDTEPYWMAAETPLIESFGGTWSHEQALGLVGLGLEDSARILQGTGVRMSADAIIDHLTSEVMRQLAGTGVPFRPGARELLASLREAGIKTALVTMSMRRMAQTVVDLIDFDAFDVVIAGDDATRPKPFPDPYLQACELLGVASDLAAGLGRGAIFSASRPMRPSPSRTGPTCCARPWPRARRSSACRSWCR